jgi:hypothetical protein
MGWRFLCVLGLCLLAGCGGPRPVPPPPSPGDEDATKLLQRAREEIKGKNGAQAEAILTELIDMKISQRKQEEVVAVTVYGLSKIDAQRSKRLEQKLKEKGFPNLK